MKNNLEQLQNLFVWPDERPVVKDSNLIEYDIVTNMVYAKNNLIEGRKPVGPISQPMLGHIINRIKPKVILEIGSWMGTNTTAFMLQHTSDTHLICVDHWSDDYRDYIQHVVATKESLEDKNNQDNSGVLLLPHVWDCFLINGWSNKHRLTPVRKKSREALPLLKELNIPVDLIYIDANHNYEEALYDIKTCCEIWPNAVICGDDLYWPDGGVRRAVEECAYLFDKIPNDWHGSWYFTKF